MKWKNLTDEMTSKIKDGSKRKIRLSKWGKKEEIWARWDTFEKCFWWDQGEAAVYMDDTQQRPTHILIG